MLQDAKGRVLRLGYLEALIAKLEDPVFTSASTVGAVSISKNGQKLVNSATVRHGSDLRQSMRKYPGLGLMSVRKRNNVNVVGSGERTVMFAHGYGCDQSMWRHVAPAFPDFRVVLFDYVGSGDSDGSAFDQTRYSTLKGYAADVLEIIDGLSLTGVNFVGHSVSSMIGALATIEDPSKFESLTMIGPSPCYINDGDYVGGFERSDIEALLESLESNQMSWSASMAPAIMGKENGPELSGELEASFCRMDPFLAHHFARVTFLSDNRADLPKVPVRTLILQCQKDVIAGLQVGEYVHRCLPNSQFVLMDATGHCPHMSAPEKVTNALKRFLETGQ